jgi:hypothetical protein
MRLDFPRLGLALIAVLIGGLSLSVTWAGPADGLDLRLRFQRFNSERSRSLWAFEDQLIQDERSLVDRMRNELRLYEIEYGQKIEAGTEWSRARREYKESLRKYQGELKQQIKIRREEFELKILRFMSEREVEQKAFLDELDGELKKLSKAPGIGQARSDFESARTEIRESLSRFRDRMRNSRPKENFWE